MSVKNVINNVEERIDIQPRKTTIEQRYSKILFLKKKETELKQSIQSVIDEIDICKKERTKLDVELAKDIKNNHILVYIDGKPILLTTKTNTGYVEDSRVHEMKFLTPEKLEEELMIKKLSRSKK